METGQKVAPRTRKEELEATLNAYRCGWISYDRSRVIEVRAELRRIRNAG